MRSTSSSLDVVDDGDGGGGEAGGDGALARLGTGLWAPGGGAGLATQGLGPSHARYRDNMLARRHSSTASRARAASLYIARGLPQLYFTTLIFPMNVIRFSALL